MSVHTKRVAGPIVVGTSDTTIGTVPAGKTWRVTGMSADNAGAGTTTFQLGIGATGLGANVFRASVNVGNAILSTGIVLVFHAGEVVKAKASVASALTLSMHGSELDGVA
jgi:hypothetical protein